MVVGDGQAYSGNFGFDLDGLRRAPRQMRHPVLVRVDPDGTIHEAADDLRSPTAR